MKNPFDYIFVFLSNPFRWGSIGHALLAALGLAAAPFGAAAGASAPKHRRTPSAEAGAGAGGGGGGGVWAW